MAVKDGWPYKPVTEKCRFYSAPLNGKSSKRYNFSTHYILRKPPTIGQIFWIYHSVNLHMVITFTQYNISTVSLGTVFTDHHSWYALNKPLGVGVDYLFCHTHRRRYEGISYQQTSKVQFLCKRTFYDWRSMKLCKENTNVSEMHFSPCNKVAI